MAQQFIPYTVTGSQRWDTVANAAYGKASAYPAIIAANPNIPVTPIIPGGTVLQIPVLENNSIETAKEQLPPWKQ